ncbi:MAG: tRNA uridine-5-carboxymethylaminomethyl(34) synthesis GTPase MnmE, partial [Gammaproteobacteria bacterium]|nr:tRNA uridine-5-carboxymethylaminomethyl(34) synthesis GTPase MnmE [Gammaproteobacteria bacterium]
MSYPGSEDTIAAIATPPGRGGVGIVRVSGPRAKDIAHQILPAVPAARYAQYGVFLDKNSEILDEGLALIFNAPHSFTGDDVLELQGHGGPVVMHLLLQRACELGARLAKPGEFSQRAFFNGKMDLAQAEAISDLINSSTDAAARSALRSLQGAFSNRIRDILEQTISLRMYIEAAIDFPEEEIDFLADTQVQSRAHTLHCALENIFQEARQGVVLNDGMHVVILGQPNAGKSSLLNCLAGRDSAIVTDIPGTTRDVLREQIQIDGMPLHIIDTAGLREGADVIEQEGIRRAWAEVARADRVLLLVDDTRGITDVERGMLHKMPAGVAVTLVFNKIDSTGRAAALGAWEDYTTVALSAKSGIGVQILRGHLKDAMGYTGEGAFLARRRHVDALQRARAALHSGLDALQQARAGELLAEELRVVQAALNEITGEFDNE